MRARPGRAGPAPPPPGSPRPGRWLPRRSTSNASGSRSASSRSPTAGTAALAASEPLLEGDVSEAGWPFGGGSFALIAHGEGMAAAVRLADLDHRPYRPHPGAHPERPEVLAASRDGSRRRDHHRRRGWTQGPKRPGDLVRPAEEVSDQLDIAAREAGANAGGGHRAACHVHGPDLHAVQAVRRREFAERHHSTAAAMTEPEILPDDDDPDAHPGAQDVTGEPVGGNAQHGRVGRQQDDELGSGVAE